MKARFLEEAEVELDEATEYYCAVGLSFGRRFSEAIDRCIGTIESRPQTFPKVDQPFPGREVRSLSLDGFPFSMIYEVRGDEIVLLAVAHHRRRSGYWHRRKP